MAKTIEILDIGTQLFLHVTIAADSWLCCQIVNGMSADRAKGIAFVVPRTRTRNYVMPENYDSLAYDFKDYNYGLDLDAMFSGITWASVCAHLIQYPSLAAIPDSINIQAMRELLAKERGLLIKQ